MNLGVIPGRLNSTRFPKKIVYPLKGKSVIQHVYDNAKESKLLSHLVIAIDSMETLSHLNKDSETILTSKGHESGTDRVAEVAGKFNCDIVVNIQGDEPNIDAQLIDNLIIDESYLEKFDIGNEVKKSGFDNKKDLFLHINYLKTSIIDLHKGASGETF